MVQLGVSTVSNEYTSQLAQGAIRVVRLFGPKRTQGIDFESFFSENWYIDI